ncbi:methylenetetrahydrofolate reductase [NAD(P)H] [Rhodothalassium salexigens]|uniref:methylenetetrahydrofolate reductase n=1 Tax=Rhodothalassium salexigens TaxID=1086 RepID=UPI001914BC99|nr:methylenetetrahydrofolate reductase [Rhodothalassium salexigens]MBK5910415.1 methylenetetrahydrofolate reductase [NAD(P)H] [Rhodothalassium salexigens]MBK5919532.1 methylenetetrahydrofolate reductase [NAD(P)H] [Rhodothalassium salexigens]
MTHIDAHAPGLQPSLYADFGEPLKISFEFFPPKTDAMEQTLWQSVKTLEPLGPRFVSVTYGAGGSTRERTHATVKRILEETDLTPAAHLTCVCHTKDEVKRIAQEYWDMGVRHIVALRGDAPGDDYEGDPWAEGYKNGAELVAGLREVGDFDISVGAYPEVHPDSPNLAGDLDNLKRKVDAGANRAITQFFFETDMYWRYLDHAQSHGIDVPIVPGILPVSNMKTLKRFAAGCGATVPDWMVELFEGLDDQPMTRNLVSATVAGEMVKRLYAGGVREFHFYTLNRAELTYAICHLLGIRPQGQAAMIEAAE